MKNFKQDQVINSEDDLYFRMMIISLYLRTIERQNVNTISLFYLLREIVLNSLQHYELELFFILCSSLHLVLKSLQHSLMILIPCSTLALPLSIFFLSVFIIYYVKQSRVFISGYVTELGYRGKLNIVTTLTEKPS